MILNMSGGGASLNFAVVGGTTQPANPKENTVWVNTDVNIPYWVFSSINPYEHESENLYKTATNAGRILSDGSIVSDSEVKYTDYIELPNNVQSITITMGTGTTSTTCHAFYDESKELISTFYRTAGTSSHDAPANAKYIRVCSYKSESVTLIAKYISVIEEGTVWITTGTNSLGEFNALKKNSITVYPISAKQYVDGVWVDKVAKSYIGGAWVEWTAYLYKAGDECIGITGGWTGEGYAHIHSTKPGTKNADNLYCYSASETEFRVLGTRNAIDFTNYNTLYVDGILSRYGISVRTTKNYTDGSWGAAQLRNDSGARDVYTLDISKLSGSYYIAAWGYNGQAVRVYNAWLER